MAVAAHVSRVSSDYPPSGYSIMRREVLSVDAAVGDGPFTMPLVFSDQGGLWIEAIRVMWPMGYGTNFPGGGADPVGEGWAVDVNSITLNPGGAPTFPVNILHLETPGIGGPPGYPGAGDNFPVVPPGAPGGPPFGGRFVAPGSFLGITVTETGTPGSDLVMQFHVRYRAKA